MATLQDLLLGKLMDATSEGARSGSSAIAQLQGKRAQQNIDQQNFQAAQDYVQENAKKGRSVNAHIGNAAVTQNEPNPLMQMMGEQAREGNRLQTEKDKTFGKMEEGLGMAKTAESFLQNPNAGNAKELQVLIPMMQGWPARAMGTEVKASGFNSDMWSKVLSKVNDFANNPQASPLTQADLDTFRSNLGVVKNGLIKRHDAAMKQFWGTTAKTLAPMIAQQGGLGALQQAHEQSLQDAYGDYRHSPWEQGSQAAQQTPPQPVQNTQPAGTQSLMGGLFNKASNALHSFFGGSSAAPGAAYDGSTPPPAGATPQMHEARKQYLLKKQQGSGNAPLGQ